jgi:hypothetical protein
MRSRDVTGFNRRDFLKRIGVAAGARIVRGVSYAKVQGISIIVDRDDPVGSSVPAKWATAELQKSLEAHRIAIELREPMPELPSALTIVIAGTASGLARDILKRSGVELPPGEEVVGLVPAKVGERPVLLACGNDPRGAVYALLELADRLQHATEPLAALALHSAVVERPANDIRGINRSFVSEVEDKNWYYDRAMWPRYLSMLAAQRFNRFSLTFGIGYDLNRNLRDTYFFFAYPFLVSVPGYNVRVLGLPEGERERNLEMLRFISEETANRGLQFQLGIWTHAYQWIDSPDANYTIEGLTPEAHADYCRNALLTILKACPAITGVTFRTHGESGIPEGSYSFWNAVFQGVAACGRRVEIDQHAKGINQQLIDLSLSTGMPVAVSPKFVAEHMGLPYQHAAIRELEMPPKTPKDEGHFLLSSGSRRFMRYGYGDLLAEDRRYKVVFRIWPGTQRLLLWGDPLFAAAYARAFSFCSSSGVDICEPLFFKGRKGSGLAGGRCAYADASLKPEYDWEKYLYTYRVWGRLLFNPQADADIWRRFLRRHFQEAARDLESALGNASRILPLITTAHGPSAANAAYWPEMYTAMPIARVAQKTPYGDSPTPRLFATVSPFDPKLFLSVEDFAQELLSGERTGKYSPVEVAQRIENWASAATKHLSQAEAVNKSRRSPEFRRMAADVAIQSGLGRFFASEFRSAVLYAIYERSRDLGALQAALKGCRAARAAWTELADVAKRVYVTDVTFGNDEHLRGHWLDRLAAIDEDIAEMEKQLSEPRTDAASAPAGNSTRVAQVVREALTGTQRPSVALIHAAPAQFLPGQPLEIVFALQNNDRHLRPTLVRLHYRHINQAETYQVQDMDRRENRYLTMIPGKYTDSPFPLLYFFELRAGSGAAWLYPGFDSDLANQPYFMVRRASA